jgi:glycosyltransferase involved in cell wall biosynthesis
MDASEAPPAAAPAPAPSAPVTTAAPAPSAPVTTAAPAPVVAPSPAGDRHAPVPPVASVVLPCYNEGDHVLLELERITAALDASGLTYEILAIDDASTDHTLQVLRDAESRFPQLRVVAFRRNGGSGTARRIGTGLARGEIVVWTDADMTYPNERIPELVQVLLTDPSFDQVVGARTTEEGTHKWLRVPAKWFIRKVAERLTNQEIPDLNSGLRAFRRSVSLPYLRLLPPGFSCVTTITLSFLSNQHDIKYVPIDYAKRAGTSKFHFLHDAYRYILQVLRMVMYFDPLKVLMPPALWLLLIGLVKGVVDMVRHPFYFPASTVLIVISSLIIASMALLADLVVRSRGDQNADPGWLAGDEPGPRR